MTMGEQAEAGKDLQVYSGHRCWGHEGQDTDLGAQTGLLVLNCGSSKSAARFSSAKDLAGAAGGCSPTGDLC